MATAYTRRSNNIAKTWLLMTSFLVMIIGLGFAATWYFGSSLILYIAIAFSLLMNITSYWFSDRIVLGMSGAKPASREEYFDLWNAVENLSITAGLPMPKVYVIEEEVPNAFATGRNKEKATVAVTTGLLKILDKSELEGVIAHELAHIQNNDILLQTVVVVLVGFVTLLSDFFLRFAFFGGGGDRGGQAKLIGIVIGITLAILAPLVAVVIQLAISRKREFMADASGALLTRYPEGLAGALEKIGGYAGEMKRANHATAHLYISNPFGSEHKGKKKKSFVNRMFSTHPPIEDRIRALLE
ncbi:MAG: M48 family metallopeptidase [Candidatus Campbellbacteria bacterium]|nr:M48 family metallopeptidase [Candidatus Campbellbacteria bacterium]